MASGVSRFNIRTWGKVMEVTPLYRCVAALDVHQAKLTVCVLRGEADGELSVALREFGGFKRDRREMVRWVASFAPESVVMESTGIYWKSPYAALEQVGLRAFVVNARHVKQVPGRKTDLADAQWLAILARSGLLRGGLRAAGQFSPHAPDFPTDAEVDWHARRREEPSAQGTH